MFWKRDLYYDIHITRADCTTAFEFLFTGSCPREVSFFFGVVVGKFGTRKIEEAKLNYQKGPLAEACKPLDTNVYEVMTRKLYDGVPFCCPVILRKMEFHCCPPSLPVVLPLVHVIPRLHG